jgi:hypothetical protein
MPTIAGCRKLPKSIHFPKRSLMLNSRFFPSTEPETESDWEEVEGGESAENGPAVMEGEEVEGESSNVALPDAPTEEPVEEGPATKKQKSNEE